MNLASSIFWIAGFILSVIMGPTLRIWTWGPTMLCFAIATALVIPNIWRDGIGKFNLYILITGFATTAWFAGRAWFSPAEELALMDLSLVMMAASTFIVFHNVFRSNSAQIAIIIGIALLLCTNLTVMAVQYKDITYNLLIPHTLQMWPAGVFRHYSHCATFLICSSLLLGGFSLRSSWPLLARITLFLIAIIGLAAVFITKSRGGLIGASGGFFTLLIYWLLNTKRDDRKWSGVALIIAPICMIVIAAIALSLLESVQQSRNNGSDLIDMMDNDIRLYLYGIAASCITLHPFMGGGSRSFSWENYQFWIIDEMGGIDRDPEHVHNEFVQVFTDYGIIGAGILIAFICGILILCTFRSLIQGEWSKYAHADAWRIGGIAAFIGIFIQSNFEGVLRTAPGAIMLAICLAASCHGCVNLISKPINRLWLQRILLTSISITAICLLALFGWKGSMVSKNLWATVFEKSPISPEIKIQSYTAALNHWDLESSHRERGILYIDLAKQKTDKIQSHELFELSIQDFQKAEKLHPYSPLYPRNIANALSSLGKTDESSDYYEKAIRLQGGMEAAYKSRFLYAQHLFLAGIKEQYTGSSSLAIKHFTRATELLDSFPPYLHGAPYYTLKKDIVSNSASAYQDLGQFKLALENYDLATSVHLDPDTSYFAANMLMENAELALSDNRPSDALRLFSEAEKRFQTSSLLSPEERNQILSELRKKIEALQQANHSPSQEIHFK